jgi:hypothetical protein
MSEYLCPLINIINLAMGNKYLKQYQNFKDIDSTWNAHKMIMLPAYPNKLNFLV